ncbi:MAG: leucyl/phenylalanyl-tRNA--protein transferase [Chlorobi bacterium]|nr:leucyl/phenylalanyl-tRNA--protein transferase [Chlorobiota bacterium]
MIFQLPEDFVFPDPKLADDSGLLAVGGDLSTQRLLLAYWYGIFPWFNEGDPIMWWSPPVRPVFYPGKIKVSKSLKQVIRKGMFEVKLDTRFEEVMRACSMPRKDLEGTWINEEMITAYTRLHEFGFAHSVECYLEGELAGGLYGVSLGKAFFGESMFFRVSNASKVAFFALSENLKDMDFHFIDSQVTNSHLLSLGAEEVQRDEFMQMLEKALKQPHTRGKWKNLIPDLKERL